MFHAYTSHFHSSRRQGSNSVCGWYWLLACEWCDGCSTAPANAKEHWPSTYSTLRAALFVTSTLRAPWAMLGLASPQLKSRHFLDFLRRCLPLSSTHDAGRALHSELRKIVLGLACPCLDWMPFVDGVTLPTIQQPSLARRQWRGGAKQASYAR